jgi:hypothetical protein
MSDSTQLPASPSMPQTEDGDARKNRPELALVAWYWCAIARAWFVRCRRGTRPGSSYPPPGKSPALQQFDEAACTRGSSGYVRVYVECMQARGYRPEIIGQGGVRMTVTQLPLPPRAIVRPQMNAPPPQASKPLNTVDPIPYRKFSQGQVNHLIEMCPNPSERAARPRCSVAARQQGRSIMQGVRTQNHPVPDPVRSIDAVR